MRMHLDLDENTGLHGVTFSSVEASQVLSQTTGKMNCSLRILKQTVCTVIYQKSVHTKADKTSPNSCSNHVPFIPYLKK